MMHCRTAMATSDAVPEDMGALIIGRQVAFHERPASSFFSTKRVMLKHDKLNITGHYFGQRLADYRVVSPGR